ncbi:hypothetical protein M2323_001790 [Rhodoblastus acidophilus]|uniref:FeoC-like transcriptional regulator n=1 Tax=Rhodoblastus acidophilus TaxID=1074 RepID=UPI002223EFE1|nr:FeoC-like transcriptional regulator [Rhodoblastus acidophilus]MCW2283778.1 hypothetical protein [Rhodoblastus acidophilus]MCW2332873.1 hypothetical protein [Rhodoblastus acidophilus]
MAMTLMEAKAYLVARRRATLVDIATHFDSSPDAARQLMRHWLDKGRVKLLECRQCDAGCHCGRGPDEIYEWVS